MRVGYVRCSTAEQNEARQMKMMEEQKVEKIFIDKASGKNVDRKDFKAMMAFVRAGDAVIVESISRIARNTRDLLTIISSLTEKGVEFVSLKENIDTTTPHCVRRPCGARLPLRMVHPCRSPWCMAAGDCGAQPPCWVYIFELRVFVC